MEQMMMDMMFEGLIQPSEEMIDDYLNIQKLKEEKEAGDWSAGKAPAGTRAQRRGRRDSQARLGQRPVWRQDYVRTRPLAPTIQFDSGEYSGSGKGGGER